jgi:hypothetical protein
MLNEFYGMFFCRTSSSLHSWQRTEVRRCFVRLQTNGCRKCYSYLCVITAKMVMSSPDCISQVPSWRIKLVRKFLAIYGIRRFVTVFTRARHCFISNLSLSGDFCYTYLICAALGNPCPPALVWYLWQMLACSNECNRLLPYVHKDASSIRCRSPKAVCLHLRLVCFHAVLDSVYQADIASNVYDSNTMERLWKDAVV